MSTPYTDNDIALPHASLLAYFRRPTTAQQPDNSSEPLPPPYNTCHESHEGFFDVPRVSGVVEDEESQRTISMHFCLATPNREAPGPQTWRYMGPSQTSHRDCTTELATLLAAGPSELLQIHPGGTISFTNAELARSSSDKTPGYNASSLEDEEDEEVVESLGDDLAEEGGTLRSIAARRYKRLMILTA
ncbi:hypothetical protein N0V83_001942 [Neocucurbitaria cava]|uniref:Uncharacterized protein n=1 Tax=Neocucurbitaria cava TaxID=798079 RepID=A0A9W8YDL7_9PLEO|nr:hypothetical protein N0V83_001942 [Neocucurbitaria cava]